MSDPIRSDQPLIAMTAYWPTRQVCLIRLAGELDAATTPELTHYLREQTTTRPTHLVLDLAHVQFLASAGIGLILTALHNADGIHGRLHLLGITDNHIVARVLDLCGLRPLLDIHDSLDELLDDPDHN